MLIGTATGVDPNMALAVIGLSAMPSRDNTTKLYGKFQGEPGNWEEQAVLAHATTCKLP
jgi:hypothetical protein